MLTIRSRLNLVIITVTTILILLFISNAITLDTANTIYDLRHKLDRLHVLMLEMRRSEKDFLLRLDLKYVDRHQDFFKQGREQITLVETATEKADLGVFDPEAKQVLESYAQSFNRLVSGAQEIGLNQNEGMHGKLRTIAHQVEDAISSYPQLMIGLLQMRRAEKDFLQRKDRQYVEHFQSELEKTMALLQKNPMPTGKRDEVMKLFQDYGHQFLALVNKQTELGLTEKDGLQGSFRNDVHRLEKIIADQEQVLDKKIFLKTAVAKRSAWIRSSILGAGILLALGFLAFSRRNILEKINHAAATAERLGSGELEKPVAVAGTDEIAVLLGSMENMRRNIVAANNVVHVSNRLSTRLNELSQHLAGITDMKQLADAALGKMTRFMDCQVAAMFIRDDEGNHAFVSGYGLGEKTARTLLREGGCCAGEAIKEKRVKVLDDVGSSQLRIESGLGACRPTQLVMLPLVRDGNVCGYIELGSINPQSEVDIPFLEKAGEIVAIAVETAKDRVQLQQAAGKSARHVIELEEKNLRMQQAHEEIRRQSEQLQLQQEELQAQQEELKAMNEELETYARQMENQLIAIRA